MNCIKIIRDSGRVERSTSIYKINDFYCTVKFFEENENAIFIFLHGKDEDLFVKKFGRTLHKKNVFVYNGKVS